LYLRPVTLDEAVRALASQGGQILAGGTDVFPALVDRPLPEAIIDISGLNEIRGITQDETLFRIGGLTTWTEFIRTPLPHCFDGLKAAAQEIGSVQIQNRGTIAGNLCNASPAADSVPPLLTLDAEVELVSDMGRRRMPLSEFIVGNRKTTLRPGEILSYVFIPRPTQNTASAFLKLGARRYLVISIAMAAALVAVDSERRVLEARISVGSCSVVAKRLHTLEQSLVGALAIPGWSSQVSREHLRDLAPISDVRATAEYRIDAALQLVKRTLEACARSIHG
jgi:CO/xanthine dehydrogenase FAD-binding subunit